VVKAAFFHHEDTKFTKGLKRISSNVLRLSFFVFFVLFVVKAAFFHHEGHEVHEGL
jgi:hypothetical protein